MNLHYFLAFIRKRPINEFLNFTFGFSFCYKIQIPRNGIIRIVDRGLLSIGFYFLYFCLAYKRKAKLTYACWIFGDFFQYFGVWSDRSNTLSTIFYACKTALLNTFLVADLGLTM